MHVTYASCSRFIEWMDCCCGSGGDGDRRWSSVKEERGEESQLELPFCRDVCAKHSVRSQACETLARYPYFMPLDSGFASPPFLKLLFFQKIHGEVVMSAQPRWWFIHTHSTDTNASLVDSIGIGTRVLIPILNGLVELFATRFMAKDEEMVEFITANCRIIPPLQNLPISLNSTLIFPSIIEAANTTHLTLKQAEGEPSAPPKTPKYSKHSIRASKNVNYCQSKNLVTERNRRSRIKHGLLALRALVPNISKMDKASILSDAIEYIGELKKEVKRLQEELEQNSPSSHMEPSVHPIISKQGLSSFPSPKKMEVKLEVNQITRGSFLVRLLCEHKRGGLRQLVEVLCSLGLQVVDANITTTFNGRALNILKVEGNKDISSKKLKQSLIELMD